MFAKITNNRLFRTLFSRGRYRSTTLKHKARYKETFVKIEDAMTKKQLFLDANLSIRKLAVEASTNRTYITRTLKSKGINFAAYVNAFRLVRALQILGDRKNRDLSMYEVAYLSGFGTERVLNHFLLNTLGITGSILRKRAMFSFPLEEKGTKAKKPL